MSAGSEITVFNKLVAEQRDVNIYHHNGKNANLISHGRLVTIPLQPAESGDYLHISIVRGPGRLEKTCKIDLPGWLDFYFSGIGGDGALSHQGERVSLTIPPGPPDWQIKITIPSHTTGVKDTTDDAFITIGDAGEV